MSTLKGNSRRIKEIALLERTLIESEKIHSESKRITPSRRVAAAFGQGSAPAKGKTHTMQQAVTHLKK